MSNEIKDEEFERLLAEKKHKELLTAITKMATAMKPDKAVAEAIEVQADAINKLIADLKNINKTNISVGTSDSKALSLIKTMASEINKNLEELRKEIAKKREYRFDVQRNEDGFMESINVTEK